MFRHMKAVTIHVNEPVYREFKEQARQRERPTSELIRAAMDEYRERHFCGGTSLAEPMPPASVGAVLEPWGSRAELLGSYLDRDR